MKVNQIAALLQAPFEGDGDRNIVDGAALEAAEAQEIAFLDGSGGRSLAGSRAGCVIVPREFAGADGQTIIRVGQPRNCFARVMRELRPGEVPVGGAHPSAVVAASARVADTAVVGPLAVIGENATVGAGTVIGPSAVVGEGVRVGEDCRIHAGVALYPRVSVGNRTVIHSGSVIGADGFGLVFEGDHYEKFPQLGTVEIGSDVEIGANGCVDRGALGPTVIGDGTKLDNMVHIGHNCRLGRHVVIAAQTGLSGGVIVDDYVIMGGQVGIGERAHIEAKAVLGGQCGPLPGKTLAAGGTYWGTPARPYRQHMERLALVNRLPALFAELKALRERMAELEKE